MDIYFKKKNTILFNGVLINFDTPKVMGILNITPDSFYDGGKHNDVEGAIDKVGQMVKDGAAIIDVGACSTRPGSIDVGVDIELKRLLPVVKLIKQEYPDVLVSIDTYQSKVVENVVSQVGCCIVNDISGGNLDDKMFETVADLKLPYVLMHIQGAPQTMQKNPQYNNVTKEVILDLSKKVNRLHQLGVNDVILDPGFGFGKKVDHNYQLFSDLEDFRFFELPLLVGVSRKSMIYKYFNSSPQESLNGTTILNTLAIQKGADILRVHDVKEAVEVIAIIEKIRSFSVC